MVPWGMVQERCISQIWPRLILICLKIDLKSLSSIDNNTFLQFLFSSCPFRTKKRKWHQRLQDAACAWTADDVCVCFGSKWERDWRIDHNEERFCSDYEILIIVIRRKQSSACSKLIKIKYQIDSSDCEVRSVEVMYYCALCHSNSVWGRQKACNKYILQSLGPSPN